MANLQYLYPLIFAKCVGLLSPSSLSKLFGISFGRWTLANIFAYVLSHSPHCPIPTHSSPLSHSKRVAPYSLSLWYSAPHLSLYRRRPLRILHWRFFSFLSHHLLHRLRCFLCTRCQFDLWSFILPYILNPTQWRNDICISVCPLRWLSCNVFSSVYLYMGREWIEKNGWEKWEK